VRIMLNFSKLSIGNRIIAMMMAVLVVVLIAAIIVPISTLQIVQDYDDRSHELSERQTHIAEIADYTKEIILRVRGYFAYLDSYEYEQIFHAKQELDKSITALKSKPLTEEMQVLVQRIESFFEHYLSGVVKEGAAYAEVGDYESLRQLITYGADNPVNDILFYAHESEKHIRAQIEEEKFSLLQKLFLQGMLFIIYIIVIFTTAIFITRRLATDIGRPISQLSKYALNYSKGEYMQEKLLHRSDEIGLLARSLNSMIYEINEKEEELLAQNEELQAQQDELQSQQDELHMALSRMEENEVYLNKRNTLTQSLANTLNREELLGSIIRNLAEITKSDKGILIVMNESQDYAAYGISTDETAQFLKGFKHSAAFRALYSKQLYIRERDATAGEKGYLLEAVQANDIFIPIYRGNGDMMACLVLTRVGKCFESREEVEITALSMQISLSLEKLEMFDSIESQRQMTQNMLNTIQEGVQLLNLEGKTLQVNEKLYELMDLSYAEFGMHGLSLEAFKHLLASRSEHSEQLFHFIQDALQGTTDHATSMNYVLMNGGSRFIQIYWEPIYSSKEKMGILLVHRDITKEHEVDRIKSEFVSTVSHELRTPLASILGFSELLLHREVKPERAQKYIFSIHQEAKRLTQLVNDFLDLQRMENGMQNYDIKPIDIVSLIDEVKELQQSSTNQHRIVYPIPDESMIVAGDRDKLIQLLMNLLGNAIKYSPEGGDILISTSRENENIWIEIRDEGLGIPEQSIPSLFTKFYRVDNSDRRKIGGTGLGLAIVKEIVTNHHGEIKVSSQNGVGSAFSFSLPVYKSD
jgi:signal transduction histidine kinase/HAMP domain-containing protein